MRFSKIFFKSIIFVIMLFGFYSYTSQVALALSAPRGLRSSCSADGRTVILSWDPVPGASYYSIRVDDTTQGINNNPCLGTTGDYCNETVYGTSITVQIRPGDSYRWWVHARDWLGNWSDAAIGYFKCSSSCSCTPWVNQGCGKGGCASNQMYQTRTCTPSGCDVQSQCVYDSSCAYVPPPTGLSYNCNPDGTVTISWNPVPAPLPGSTIHYAVRLDANAPSWNGSYWDTHCTDSGSWYCYDYCQNSVTGTSITLKIGYNSPYDFWIHSRSSTGQWSDATHLYFTCPKTPPDPPSNLNAQCSSDGKKVTLSWSGTGVKYALRLDKNPYSWDEWRWCEIGCNGWDWATGDYCKDFVYSQSITLDVEPNTQYMWWVHTLDSEGVWSSPTLSYFKCVSTQCGNGVCESGENCSNCPSDCPCPSGQVCQNGTCVTPQPTNNLPSATNLKVTQPDYCKVGPGATIFSWTFTDPDGDSQSAYQVQVDNNSNFSSPEVDSGKINSSSNSYTPQTGLNYNTTYYWRVMVWDSKGAQSLWSYGPSFTTPKHLWPTPDFTFSPEKPYLGQVVQFTDKSQAFGGTTIKSWDWTFQNGNPPSSTIQNPTTTFSSIGKSKITLKVTDSSGYSCSVSKSLRTTYPLPFWKEIPPF